MRAPFLVCVLFARSSDANRAEGLDHETLLTCYRNHRCDDYLFFNARDVLATSFGLPPHGNIPNTHDMITKNIGMLLLAIYLIAVGILTLTGLGIGIITGVLALLAGIFILIGR